MTLVRLAARMHRRGLVGCGLLLLLFGLAQGAGYRKVAGDTAASRRAFAAQMDVLGRQLTYMLPLPERADTLAGFVQWRAFGTFALIVACWAVVAAAGATRGDEEHGLTEQWLCAGRSRVALLASRVAGFALVAAMVVAGSVAGAALGARAAAESLPLAGLAVQGVALVALGVCCFGVTALVAQLTATRRGAVAASGATLLALFALNAAGRTNPALASARQLSPFYHYDQVRALVPGVEPSAAAPATLLAAAVVLAGAAGAAFARRDLGAALVSRRRRGGPPVVTPSRNPLLRVPVAAGLYEQRWGLAAWCAALLAGGYFYTSLARSMVGLFRATPAMRAALEAMSGGADLYTTFIGFAWFGTLSLALALYAVAQTSSWVAEDLEGRLEMVLATPTSRRRVVLERFGTLLVAATTLAGVATLAVAAGSAAQGVALPAARLLVAGALLVPVVTSVAAVGAALAAVAPRAASTVVGAVAVASYFVQSIGAIFRWPEWVMNLSVFQLYGSPLVHGVRWGGLAAMVAVTVAGFVVTALALERRDVGK